MRFIFEVESSMSESFQVDLAFPEPALRKMTGRKFINDLTNIVLK